MSLSPTTISTSVQNDTLIPSRLRDILLVPLIIVLFILTTPFYFSIYTHLVLGVTIPIFGILTRYRAHHAPRASSATPDDEANSKQNGPEQPKVQMGSMLAVGRRVVQLEGWIGLWRGWVPIVVATLVMQVLGSLEPWYDVFSAVTQTDLPPKLLNDLCALPLLLAFFLTTTREVTAPFAVDWWHPLSAFQSLFPDYTTFSFIINTVSILALGILRIIFRGVSDYLVEIANEILSPFRGPLIEDGDHFDGSPPMMTPALFWRLAQLAAICLAVKLVVSVPVCVLDVLVVRLATPRLGSASTSEPSTSVSKPAGSSESEPVTHLHELAYASPLHCLAAVWREEGPGALLRGFWVTWLTSMFDVFPVGLCFAVWTA